MMNGLSQLPRGLESLSELIDSLEFRGVIRQRGNQCTGQIGPPGQEDSDSVYLCALLSLRIV
jgi:hypothetical protein